MFKREIYRYAFTGAATLAAQAYSVLCCSQDRVRELEVDVQQLTKELDESRALATDRQRTINVQQEKMEDLRTQV